MELLDDILTHLPTFTEFCQILAVTAIGSTIGFSWVCILYGWSH